MILNFSLFLFLFSSEKLASEKEDVEREKWEIIKRAREAAERSVMLQSKLDSKEKLVQKMQSDLSEVRICLRY